MFRHVSTRLLIASLAFAGLAVQGCSSDQLVTAPQSGNTSLATMGRRTHVAEDGWAVVATAKIIPGQIMTLTGSRYTLEFPHGAVHNAMEITMSERDSRFVDVKLDPDGTTFGEPVTLVIDYTGTPSDPDGPFFDGFAPRVGRFNPATETWTEMPGVNDPSAKTYTVMLSGFSRYAMGDGVQDMDTGHDSKHNERVQ